MSETETPEFKGKATRRLGQRELARITMAVIAVIVVGLLYGGWKAVEGFKTKRDLVIAQDNLLNLYRAMRGYALDYDSKLPPAENWSDAVLGYLSSSQARPGGKEAYLIGTSELGPVAYVYNDAASGYNLEPNGKEDDRQRKIDPHNLILLIERVGAPRNAHAYLPPQDSVAHRGGVGETVEFSARCRRRQKRLDRRALCRRQYRDADPSGHQTLTPLLFSRQENPARWEPHIRRG